HTRFRHQSSGIQALRSTSGAKMYGNDNTPRSPAEHRAHVEALPIVRQRPHVATSHLATRLARACRRQDLRMLQTFGGAAEVETWHQARGNLPETKGEMVFDRVLETRPSPDELSVLAAREAIRPRNIT